MQQLKDSNFVNITSDAATLMNGDSALTITSSWISSDWKLKKAVLALQSSPERHTSANIQELILQITEKYSLNNKISGCTTDTAANFKAAVNDLSHYDFLENSPNCACHVLQLTVVNAIYPASSKNIV